MKQFTPALVLEEFLIASIILTSHFGFKKLKLDFGKGLKEKVEAFAALFSRDCSRVGWRGFLAAAVNISLVSRRRI